MPFSCWSHQVCGAFISNFLGTDQGEPTTPGWLSPTSPLSALPFGEAEKSPPPPPLLGKKNPTPPSTFCLQIPSVKYPSSSLTSCAFHITAGHSPTEPSAPHGRDPFPPGNDPPPHSTPHPTPHPAPESSTAPDWLRLSPKPGWIIPALQR